MMATAIWIIAVAACFGVFGVFHLAWTVRDIARAWPPYVDKERREIEAEIREKSRHYWSKNPYGGVDG